MADKKIEVVKLPISELKDKLGNPRKIQKQKMEELKESMDRFGDFGVIVIDDENNIISGHQRVEALRTTKGENTEVLCKKLIGYTKSELRAINIRANTHAGEWDLSKLADWTADLNLDLGLDLQQKDFDNIRIKEMELIRYERYDYVMIVCRNEVDYLNLVRALGIEGKKIVISKKKNEDGKDSSGTRKIKARAIWYEDMKCKIVSKEK